MAYLELQPVPALAPFLEALWVQEAPADDEPSRPTRIVPTGRPDLVVQFGDPFVEVRPDGERRLAPVHVSGIRTRPQLVRASGRTGLVIVVFRPWGLAALVRGVDELTDRVEDLEHFVPRRFVRALRGEVRACSTPVQRARAVERFLLERMRSGSRDGRVVEAVRRIQAPRPPRPVSELAVDVGTSRRHLVRLFRDEIGIGPKVLARIARFQRATTHKRPGASWSDVAYACGYSDQAHLTREARELSGETPTGIARGAAAHRLARHYNSTTPNGGVGTVYL